MWQDYVPVGNNGPKPWTWQTDFQELYCIVIEGVYLLKEAFNSESSLPTDYWTIQFPATLIRASDRS